MLTSLCTKQTEYFFFFWRVPCRIQKIFHFTGRVERETQIKRILGWEYRDEPGIWGPGTSCKESEVKLKFCAIFRAPGVLLLGPLGGWEGLFHCDGGLLFVPSC